ncbi:hypothetical protein JXJ21_26590 [candidate division KSB1 bacterium]|nr:hypothetical protein [candidate division KSB1 bacterium]
MINNTDEIIARYCGDVEERIKACRSAAVANHLKIYLCSELQKQCVSDIINNYLKHYVDSLIAKNFDDSGKNISIKEDRKDRE